MKTDWQTHFRQPENEHHALRQNTGTVASGASPDAQFIFDAIYAEQEQLFVLTCLQVNDELGFIENEKRVYCATLPELRLAIDDFMRAPHDYFGD